MITEVLHNVTDVHGILVAASITDTANSLIDTVTETLVKSAIGVVVGFLIYKVIKSRFAVSAIIGAALAAGLFLWLVLGGYNTIKDGLKGQVDNAGSSVVQVTDTAHTWEL